MSGTIDRGAIALSGQNPLIHSESQEAKGAAAPVASASSAFVAEALPQAPASNSNISNNVSVRLLKGNDKLHALNSMALLAWEAYVEEGAAKEKDQAAGWMSSVVPGMRENSARKIKLQQDMLAYVREEFQSGRVNALKAALEKLVQSGPEPLRSSAKELFEGIQDLKTPSGLVRPQTNGGLLLERLIAYTSTESPDANLAGPLYQDANHFAGSDLSGAKTSVLVCKLLQETSGDEVLLRSVEGKLKDIQQGRDITTILVDEVKKTSVDDIAEMMVLAGASKLGSLSKLHKLKKLKEAGVTGYKAAIAALAAESIVEGPALATYHIAKDSALHDTKKVLSAENLKNNFASTLLMVGGLKGAGLLSRMHFPNNGLLQHAVSLLAMFGTTQLNQKLGFTEAPREGVKASMAQDVFFYGKYSLAPRILNPFMREAALKRSAALHQEIHQLETEAYLTQNHSKKEINVENLEGKRNLKDKIPALKLIEENSALAIPFASMEFPDLLRVVPDEVYALLACVGALVGPWLYNKFVTKENMEALRKGANLRNQRIIDNFKLVKSKMTEPQIVQQPEQLEGSSVMIGSYLISGNINSPMEIAGVPCAAGFVELKGEPSYFGGIPYFVLTATLSQPHRLIGGVNRVGSSVVIGDSTIEVPAGTKVTVDLYNPSKSYLQEAHFPKPMEIEGILSESIAFYENGSVRLVLAQDRSFGKLHVPAGSRLSTDANGDLLIFASRNIDYDGIPLLASPLSSDYPILFNSKKNRLLRGTLSQDHRFSNGVELPSGARVLEFNPEGGPVSVQLSSDAIVVEKNPLKVIPREHYFAARGYKEAAKVEVDPSAIELPSRSLLILNAQGELIRVEKVEYLRPVQVAEEKPSAGEVSKSNDSPKTPESHALLLAMGLTTIDIPELFHSKIQMGLTAFMVAGVFGWMGKMLVTHLTKDPPNLSLSPQEMSSLSFIRENYRDTARSGVIDKVFAHLDAVEKDSETVSLGKGKYWAEYRRWISLLPKGDPQVDARIDAKLSSIRSAWQEGSAVKNDASLDIYQILIQSRSKNLDWLSGESDALLRPFLRFKEEVGEWNKVGLGRRPNWHSSFLGHILKAYKILMNEYPVGDIRVVKQLEDLESISPFIDWRSATTLAEFRLMESCLEGTASKLPLDHPLSQKIFRDESRELEILRLEIKGGSRVDRNVRPRIGIDILKSRLSKEVRIKLEAETELEAKNIVEERYERYGR